MTKPIFKDGVWFYENPQEHQLAQLVQFKFSFDLVDFDNWLDGLEDCPAKHDLIEYRDGLLQAMIESSDASVLLARIKPSLAYLKQARFSIEREEAILPKAKIGDSFVQGRRENSISPIRRAIRDLLSKDPSLKNKALADSISKKPPKGWSHYESPQLGRYFEKINKQEKTVYWKGFIDFASKERSLIKMK